MDAFIILLIFGIAMSLFATLALAICVVLEHDYKIKKIRRYARQQIMKQMERDKQLKGVLDTDARN